MDIFIQLFGEDEQLTSFQMGLRALVIFIIAIALLRLSGRRAFGIHSPFDHVISILLGAILSRAVVGASPFVPVITASCVIVLLYRAFGWMSVKSDTFGRIIKGDSVLIYKEGKWLHDNMRACMITEKDFMESIRTEGNSASIEEVKLAYIERNGRISIVKQEKPVSSISSY
jgi:uncharacterized membrane protein YcaP (DUF421 family)